MAWAAVSPCEQTLPRWPWLGKVLLAAALLGGLAAGWWGQRGAAPAPRPPHAATKPIEELRVGERVWTAGSAAQQPPSAVDPATWRLLRLRAESTLPNGALDVFEIETLQPPAWVARHQAQVGAWVPAPLDLEEMGVPDGFQAQVVANEPCPPLPPGPGRLVLTTVNHWNPDVWELTLAAGAGRPEVVRCTGLHKFARANGAWVNACQLQAGDELTGRWGPLRVTGLRQVPGAARVYNLTVEDEHVYHVSAVGAKSHNNNQCKGQLVPRPDGDFDLVEDGKVLRTVPKAEVLNPQVPAPATGNPFLAGKTPEPGTRGTGVKRAARQEVELVQKTGKGTVDWTPKEIEFIKTEGRLPKGTVGHHINNVADPASEAWAGDPRNIKFVRGQTGNLQEHGGNFQNHTSGPLIDREAMIQQARGQ